MKEKFSYIYANNEKISYKRTGKGRPMVCLHGWAGHEKTFDPILPYFEKYFEIYQIAWPGYGVQKARGKNYTIEDMVKWVETFRKKLNLGKIYLMGNCIGANVALEYAYHYPDFIECLILIEPHAFMPSFFNILLYPVIGRLLMRFLFKTKIGYSIVKNMFPIEDEQHKSKYTNERIKEVSISSMLSFLKTLSRYARYTNLKIRPRLNVPVILVFPEKTFGQIDKFYKMYKDIFKQLITLNVKDSLHNPAVENAFEFSKVVLPHLLKSI